MGKRNTVSGETRQNSDCEGIGSGYYTRKGIVRGINTEDGQFVFCRNGMSLLIMPGIRKTLTSL